MKWPKTFKITCILFVLLITSRVMGASLQDVIPYDAFPSLSLSGYATIAYTHDDDDGMAFVRELNQRPDNDNTNNVDTMPWLTDSRIGIQGRYSVNPQLELVTQLSFREQENQSFDNTLEWAYLGLSPHPELDIRLGRVGVDAFMLSDYRQVGYAYNWIRPPAGFYSWLPMYSIDGGDISYNFFDSQGGAWRLKTQLGEGKADFPFGENQYNFKSDVITLSLNYMQGPWNLRFGFSQLKINSEAPLGILFEPLDQISSFGIPGISNEAFSLRENMTYSGSKIKYYAFGLSYDDNKWWAQTELGYVQSSATMVTHAQMGYLSLGRRFGDFLPYVTYTKVEPTRKARQPKFDWNDLGPEVGFLQNIAISTHNATQIQQSTLSMGIRWDIHPQAAVKFQWDNTKIHSNGYGLWWSSRDKTKSERVNVLAISLELVF